MRHLFDYRSVSHEKRTLILAAMLFGSVLSYFLIVRFVMTVGEVEGNSMLPTLQDGERYLINRMIYRFRDPLPGDIIEIKTKTTWWFHHIDHETPRGGGEAAAC